MKWEGMRHIITEGTVFIDYERNNGFPGHHVKAVKLEEEYLTIVVVHSSGQEFEFTFETLDEYMDYLLMLIGVIQGSPLSYVYSVYPELKKNNVRNEHKPQIKRTNLPKGIGTFAEAPGEIIKKELEEEVKTEPKPPIQKETVEVIREIPVEVIKEVKVEVTKPDYKSRYERERRKNRYLNDAIGSLMKAASL